MREAYESGINFFDTAPVYGMGNGEELLKKAFPANSGYRPIIATKVGLRWKKRAIESIYHDLSAQSIRREVEDSLRRLGRETIDLYQVHWPDLKTPPEETFTELAKLKAEGKIRFIDISNFTVEMLMGAQKITAISTVQNRFNLLDQKAAASLLPFCKKHNIGALIYSPLASGMLSGKYDLKSKTGDWRDREFSDLFQPKAREKALKIIETLKTMGEKYTLTIPQLAILWVLLQPGVSTVIVGIRQKKHLEAAVNLPPHIPAELSFSLSQKFLK